MSTFDTSSTASTTMPSWFTDAQKNVAAGVNTAVNNMPAPGTTSAAGYETMLKGDQNPFTTGINNLSSISSGITNPWLPNGQPNTGTALGGLFAAQNAKLDQILPSVAAKEGAAGIAGGNFGGLRGQTATNTARAGALTTLAEQQNTAAVNALNTAVNADVGLGNVGSQYGTSAINSTNAANAGGLPALNTAGTILGNIGATTDKTATTTKNSGLVANTAAAANFAKSLGLGAGDIALGRTGIDWLDKILKPALTSNSTGGLPAGTGTDPGIDYGVDYATNDQIPYGTGTDPGIDYGVDYSTYDGVDY
jgi:hypothetical protein